MKATATQETMMDYTPTQEEEIARVKKLAAEKSAQMEAMLADPVIAQFEANQKTMEKKLKDYLKLKEELGKISTKLREINRPVIDEPERDGFYVYTNAHLGWGRNMEVSIDKSLLFKAMGHWWDLTNGISTVDRDRKPNFEEFIDIDDKTIEVSLVWLEDQTTYPAEALSDKGTTESSDEAEDEDED